MKVGDKVLHINPEDFGMSSFRMIVDSFTIEKLSKDGRKVRDTNGKIAYWENLVETKTDLIRWLKKLGKESDFIVRELDEEYLKYNPKYTVYKCSVDEDEFDDKYYIRLEGFKHWTVKEAKNGLLLEDGWTFCKTIDDVADFLIKRENISSESALLEKFHEWQEKFGYDKTVEIWKDFKGGTDQLEYAIDNNIDCMDYDRWQIVQKILKHELKYETANEIFNILYEKEEIEIFDCE